MDTRINLSKLIKLLKTIVFMVQCLQQLRGGTASNSLYKKGWRGQTNGCILDRVSSEMWCLLGLRGYWISLSGSRGFHWVCPSPLSTCHSSGQPGLGEAKWESPTLPANTAHSTTFCIPTSPTSTQPQRPLSTGLSDRDFLVPDKWDEKIQL